MALILIFAGSLAGIFIAAFQLLFQDASFWTGFTTYLSFSLGFPAVAIALSLALGTLRPNRQDSDVFDYHQA